MGSMLIIYDVDDMLTTIAWTPRTSIYMATLRRLANMVTLPDVHEGLIEGLDNPFSRLDMTEWSAEMMDDVLQTLITLETEITQDARSVKQAAQNQYYVSTTVSLRNGVYFDNRTNINLFNFEQGIFVIKPDRELYCPNWVFDFVLGWFLEVITHDQKSADQGTFLRLHQARHAGRVDLYILSEDHLKFLAKSLSRMVEVFRPESVHVLYSRQYLDHLNPFVGKLYEAFQAAFPNFFEAE